MPLTNDPIEAIYNALRQVYDPELGLDIVSMGLIYRLEAEGDRVKIDMTLTTPGCPVSETLPEMARLAAVNALGPGGEDRVDFQIVWDPPWCPDLIEPEALASLGL
ncbi:MAG: metal-sulfur cluster assembly factor [Acidimicrobiales bacterium]|nr:metal-sulfur cluster assembly factor [Acidimicrobiales bacterium]MCB1246908.1 metal-sulfur cluster assembly factor [Acidimicrobiia bacterium]